VAETPALLVQLCCNDDHGNFDDQLHQVEISDEADLCLKIELGPLGPGLPFSWTGDLLRFETDGQVRWFKARGHITWVGNVYWDATRMDLADALEFAEYLIRRGFSVTEHACEEPWQSFVEKLEAADG
jgi:hypothetical protein